MYHLRCESSCKMMVCVGGKPLGGRSTLDHACSRCGEGAMTESIARIPNTHELGVRGWSGGKGGELGWGCLSGGGVRRLWWFRHRSNESVVVSSCGWSGGGAGGCRSFCVCSNGCGRDVSWCRSFLVGGCVGHCSNGCGGTVPMNVVLMC